MQRNSSKALWSVSCATLVCIATSVVSCSQGSSSLTQEERVPAVQVSPTADTVLTQAPLPFDPLGLPGEELVAPIAFRDTSLSESLEPEYIDSAGSAIGDDFGSAITRDSAAAYDTYRIQLYNSRSFNEATVERRIAQEIFEYHATLDYEVPYFKVRIGDFPDIKTAEIYVRDYVKPAGYPQAWVTRVRVVPVREDTFEGALEAYFDSLRTEIDREQEILDSLEQLDSLVADSSKEPEDQ